MRFYTSAASFQGDFKTQVSARDVTISASVDIWFSLGLDLNLFIYKDIFKIISPFTFYNNFFTENEHI